MKWYLPLVCLVIIVCASCAKTNKNKVPKITFTTLVPNTVKAGSTDDVITIAFQFEDGDGDIDSLGPAVGSRIVVSTNRKVDSLEEPVEYPFPHIPDPLRGPAGEIKGGAVLHVLAAHLLLDSTQTADTFQYSLYITDVAGNKSNTITTPEVYLTR
jgi:hypothetical protein